MTSTKPYLRKKSVLIMYKVFLQFPEALRPAFPRLKEKLEDPDPGLYFFLYFSQLGFFKIFSSPGPKVHGNYCHHLASVVCKLFTFQASSPKPLGLLEPNLAGMFLGWSSTKFLFFVPVRYSRWLPRPIICSDWLKFQRSSLKLMN